MSKKSTTREDYELHFRVLRMHGVHLDDIYEAHYNPDLISSKALRSMESRGLFFTGWKNRDRESLWSEVFSDRYPEQYYQF